MLTRRAVLSSAALLGLLPLVRPAARAAALSKLDPPDAIVIDRAVSHAEALERPAGLTARVHWLTGDLSGLYFRELVPRWYARGVRPLAGFTRAAPLYILEQLALEFGQRLVHAMRLEPVVNQSADQWADEVLSTLIREPKPRKPLANRDLIRDAMLAGDPALFAWWLAPVRQPTRTAASGVAV